MKKYVLFALLFALFTNLNAEELPIDLNASTFRLDENSSRWELYYSFPENSITYTPSDSIFVAKLNFSIKFNSTIKTELSENWTIEHKVRQVPDSFKLKLFGLRAFQLKPGQYHVELIVEDPLNSQSKKTIKFPLIIKKNHTDRLEMSDLMLASLILPEKAAGQYANPMFWKNSLYVYPNPAGEFFGTDPTLKVYCELYNAKSISPKGLELIYRIFDGAGREVYYFPKSVQSLHDGIVEHIEIPINSLPTGVYKLNVSAKAVNSPDSVFSQAKFYVFNYEIPPTLTINMSEDASFERSEFATLSEERIEREFKQAKMIASKAEIEQYELLSETNAKAKFMFLFWNRRNNDTNPDLNLALVEHRRKVDFANTYFSYGRNDNGWSSDRGRVLLQYGDPTRRDFAPHNGNERPYETWFYGEIEGGVYFYFVDVGGFGNYQLVHSTKSGEFYNDYWYELYVPVSKENRDDYKRTDDERRYR